MTSLQDVSGCNCQMQEQLKVHAATVGIEAVNIIVAMRTFY